MIKPRTVFALMFYGTYCYLILSKITPPDGLTNIVVMLMSFYFGTQVKKEMK